MTPSNHLFDLVHSLDKHEKAFFRTRSGAGTKKDYLLLFDRIVAMKEYDEQKLKQKLKGHALLKRLPATKNYLYHLILESLVVFYSGKSIKTKLQALVMKVEVLLKKGHGTHCPKLLRKGREIALQHDLFPQALEIITLEKALLRGSSPATFNTLLDELLKIEQSVLLKQKNLSAYLEADSRIYDVRRKNTLPRTKKEMEFYHTLLRDKIFSDESKALSFQAKVYFFRIKGLYFTLQSRFKESYVCRSSLAQLYDAKVNLDQGELLRFSSALYELAIAQRYTGRYKEVEQTVDRMKELIHRFPGKITERESSVIFKRAIMVETDLYQSTGQFHRGITQVRTIENGLLRYGKKIDKDLLVIIHYNIACIYFGAGNYKEALRWINRILNDKDNEHAQDVVCFSRIIDLIIHIEIGNSELLEYITRSTYRFLLKRKRLYKTESLFLEFIKRASTAGSEKEMKSIYAFMKKEFEKLMKHPFERTALEYFDFISWFESKLTGRTYEALVKKRAGLISNS